MPPTHTHTSRQPPLPDRKPSSRLTHTTDQGVCVWVFVFLLLFHWWEQSCVGGDLIVLPRIACFKRVLSQGDCACVMPLPQKIGGGGEEAPGKGALGTPFRCRREFVLPERGWRSAAADPVAAPRPLVAGLPHNECRVLPPWLSVPVTRTPSLVTGHSVSPSRGPPGATRAPAPLHPRLGTQWALSLARGPVLLPREGTRRREGAKMVSVRSGTWLARLALVALLFHGSLAFYVPGVYPVEWPAGGTAQSEYAQRKGVSAGARVRGTALRAAPASGPPPGRLTAPSRCPPTAQSMSTRSPPLRRRCPLTTMRW